MDLLAYRDKFKRLFDQLSEPGNVLDSHYADKLLVKLQSSNDPEITKLLGSPFFSDLLLEALMKVDAADVAVVTFYLRLTTTVSKNELQFAKLSRNPGFILLAKVTDISQTDISPSIREAVIEMATALTAHATGVSWLLETQPWKHIFNLCYQSQTIYVQRAAYKFLARFMWTLNDFSDEQNLIKIFEYVLKPIIESPYRYIETITEEEEPSYVSSLTPSIQLLLSILEKIANICRPNVLTKLLTKHFVIKYQLLVVLHITRNEELILHISKILFLIALTTVVQSEEYSMENSLLDLSICFYNTENLLIKKRLLNLLLDYSLICNEYWSQVWINHPPPQIAHNGKTFDIQIQLILCPLVPIVSYVKQFVSDETFDDYLRKLITVSSEHATRVAYSFRDLISEFNSTEVAALQSVKRLLLMKNNLNKMQANAIFQGLYYVLKDFVPIDDSGNLILNLDPENADIKQDILYHAIDAILMLLKCHDINWHESFELVCLYNKTCNVLKVENLQIRVVLKTLDLITFAIKMFIPPNLALLLESQDGSSLHEIGELIYYKIHDKAWEIRDSALELLCECTKIAFIKYTPFQKLIMGNNLISLAATIAFNDSEMYVQASALRCIAAASKIHLLWEDLLLQHPNFYVKLTSLFQENTEGIVRKEAVHVMCEIFQNQKINNNFKNCLCKCMVAAALNDLNSEVQLVALKYWQTVINYELTYQGMIDGKFPAVTFSKDKKKIINLTEREIQKCLARILDNLSNNGCLSVLLKTLDEDVDVVVMEASLEISQNIIDILDQFNVIEIIQPENESINEVKIEKFADFAMMDSDEEDIMTKKSDEVIQDILACDDVILLESIFESKFLMKEIKEELETDYLPPTLTIKRTSPHEFLKVFKNTDFKNLIAEKRKWNAGIRSLHSVLDDILELDKNPDANSLDCY